MRLLRTVAALVMSVGAACVVASPAPAYYDSGLDPAPTWAGTRTTHSAAR
jgi:hypothetical protein